MTRPHYDPELFYPLDGKARRKPFATIDLESKDGPTESKGFTRPFLAGFYDGLSYQAFTDTNSGDPMTRPLRSGGCIDRLMHACLSHKRHGLTYYCHNGGGFDFLHLLPWLMKNLGPLGLTMSLIPVGGSRLLSIHVKVKGQKWGGWKFVDSLKLLPMKLEEAGQTLLSKGKALGSGQLFALDGSEFSLDTPSTDPAWIPYNKQDCILLYDVLEAAHDIVENEFGGEMGLTAPATAMKVFRRSFLPAPINRDTWTHEFIREGYFGGRTEKLESEGWFLGDYDLNSSYPAAMTQRLPVGGAESWGDSEPPLEWRQRRIGFCRVTVFVPDDIALPPLPVRADGAYFPKDAGLDGKLLFPTGTLKGVWEWEELENAISEGCQIVEWHESVWFEAGPLSANFVERLYRYRDKGHCYRCSQAIGKDLHCSRCGQPGYSPGFAAWAKLLLNSWYGKTGQRPERVSFHLEGDEDLPEGALPLIPDDPQCPLWVGATEIDSPFIMPQIAARITAIARVALYRAARKAQKSVVRECWSCHSKVTYRGEKRGTGWVLGSRIGGSGTHGDDACAGLGLPTIGPSGSLCPCGGHVETRNGRVYYMDTDSILTDAHLETGAALGELKDEVPRFSGFVHGKFYASKMYTLSVEPEWLKVDLLVRKAMMRRDGSYLAGLGLRSSPLTLDQAAESAEEAAWWTTRSKGLSKKNRTPKNLAWMYEGALKRLEWAADPANRYPDGGVKPLPEELEDMGTVVDERLEQFGTLAGLLEEDENGDPVLHDGGDGYQHVRSTPFRRGPLVTKVPRRLHLEGGKRRTLPDGRTVPYHVDMTQPKPGWWLDRERRREALRSARAARPDTARVGGKKSKR